MLGIDVIPAQPPKGVSTIQGNVRSLAVQEEIKRFLRDPNRGKTRKEGSLTAHHEAEQMSEDEVKESSRSSFVFEKRAGAELNEVEVSSSFGMEDRSKAKQVDVVLSDMSEPWAQTEGFWKRSLSDPYYRMMNTSGMSFRDHAGSMVTKSIAIHLLPY